MEITVSIPDKFVLSASQNGDLERQMLEAFAIEEYRREAISFGLLRELLGLSVDEANELLKSRRVEVSYTPEDIAYDRKTMELFLKK